VQPVSSVASRLAAVIGFSFGLILNDSLSLFGFIFQTVNIPVCENFY